MPVAIEGSIPSRWVACTKSDATDVTGSIGLYVGGTGDVAVKTLNYDTSVTFSAVPVGTFIPGNFTRIMSTNTTATLMLLAYA